MNVEKVLLKQRNNDNSSSNIYTNFEIHFSIKGFNETITSRMLCSRVTTHWQQADGFSVNKQPRMEYVVQPCVQSNQTLQ